MNIPTALADSYLFRGKLMHSRKDAARHHFAYDVFMLLIDLDALPRLDSSLPLFGHNRRAAVRIDDRDHLPNPNNGTLGMKAMVESHLATAGVDLGPAGRVFLLTNPRLFGYGFNPISVYYAYDSEGCFVGGLAEVSNTHREQHPYVLTDQNRMPNRRAEEDRHQMRRYTADKAFYVSPFIGMNATYELSLTPISEKMIVHIDQYWGEKDAAGQIPKQFEARLWGEVTPLSAAVLRGALWRYPLMTAKVMAAIHWEGFRTMAKGAPYLSWKRYKRQAAQD
jgi:uncharacterized protein